MSDLSSSLTSVTLYREGALCARTAALGPGLDPLLRIKGLPLSLEPGSLRARVTRGPEGLRVLEVRPQFDVELADEVSVPEEQRALEAAQEELERLKTRSARVDAELAELQALKPRFLEPPRGAPPRQAPIEAMLALADFGDARLATRLEERRALTRQLEEAQRALTLRRHRLNEASSARRTERARLSRVAVVTLSGPVEAAAELCVEYLVPGARWAPSYALRLEPGLAGGTLQLRAAVAQGTGEDWSGVRLSLSTASLARRADLPELRALKIGRSQPPPPRSGWREPPPGLEALFDAYDSAVRPLPSDARGEPDADAASPRRKVARPAPHLGEPAVRAPAPMAARPSPSTGGAPPAVSRSAPAAPRRKSAAPSAKMAMARLDDGALDGDSSASLEAAAPEFDALDDLAVMPARSHGLDEVQLDYGRLLMGDAAGPQRGRLQPGSTWDFAFVAGVSVHVDVVMAAVVRAGARASAVHALPLPANCHEARGVDHFDYRYDCAAPVDVPSTGAWTTVPVMSCDVGLAPGYVTVPSVDPKVYRTLLVTNRSAHALLPGPVDVTQGDAFLLTTTLPAVPPSAAATHRLGLGVEEAIKVARKTTFKETTGGFLGGSTVLPHELEIEINNRLGSPAPLEVRERLPFPAPDEKELKVEEADVSPRWEPLEAPVDGVVVKGARRWQVTVPAGGTMKLTAQFVIRMPGDRMLVGGNRRA